ncbi:MAG TPA: hypothetical protein VJ793_11250 [Anaerolineae bacterium]|jgi:hypothetical protein|nr:hypothetical protein [Anaerolineae bacterium]
MTQVEVEQFMHQLADRIARNIQEPYRSNLVETLDMIVSRTESDLGQRQPREHYVE